MTRRALGLLGMAGLIVIATGCGLSEAKLYKKLGKHGCEKAFECDAEGAEAAFGTETACLSDFETEASETRKTYRACKYKRKKARKYVRKYKKVECTVSSSDADELADLWDEVYDCPGAADDTGASTGTGTTAAQL